MYIYTYLYVITYILLGTTLIRGTPLHTRPKRRLLLLPRRSCLLGWRSCCCFPFFISFFDPRVLACCRRSPHPPTSAPSFTLQSSVVFLFVWYFNQIFFSLPSSLQATTTTMLWRNFRHLCRKRFPPRGPGGGDFALFRPFFSVSFAVSVGRILRTLLVLTNLWLHVLALMPRLSSWRLTCALNCILHIAIFFFCRGVVTTCEKVEPKTIPYYPVQCFAQTWKGENGKTFFAIL